jgi:hypothetical protein
MRLFRILLGFAAMALWTASAHGQTIRVVNNNPNAPSGENVYSALQEAIDEAEAGDIIHVIPSSTSYENITITKQLSLYGIGAKPDKEVPTTSMVDGIKLNSGASGVIEGLVINSDPSTGWSISINADLNK